MPTKLIGKSVLGEIGFSQDVTMMKDHFGEQLYKIRSSLPQKLQNFRCILAMTSKTNLSEIEATGGEYFPKIRKYSQAFNSYTKPTTIYTSCANGSNRMRPSCDFLIWNSKRFPNFVAITYSREAPILAFESTTGNKCLGVIMKPSLLKFGDYLFSTIKEELRGTITVTIVTCKHEENMPSVIKAFADKYDMACIIGEDSEKNPDCFCENDIGNHAVAMW